MSSDTSRPDEPEPLDAEFEPAPDEEGRAPRKGWPWLKTAGFVIAAALIGGAAGWGLGRYLPAPEPAGLSGLQTRLDALEARAEPASAGAVGQLEARVDALGELSDAVRTLREESQALRERLRALETRGVAGEPDGGALAALETRMAEAFAHAENRLDALSDRVGAAQETAETAASAAHQARAAAAAAQMSGNGDAPAPALSTGIIETLENRLSALRARLEALETGREAPDLSAAVMERLETLETRAEEALTLAGEALQAARPSPRASGDLTARALAFAALSQTAAGPGSFMAELARLERVWPDAPGLPALREHARSGAPAAARLETDFPAEAVRAAAGETRVWFGVLRIAREADSPVDAIQAALENGDLAGAVRLARALDGPAREAANGWLETAGARLEVNQAIDRLREALERAAEGETP